MSRIYAAVRQYRNGRLLFLTPDEEARLREQFRRSNEAGHSPLQEMAPCFGCNQDHSACIVFDGPEQRPTRGPDRFASNGGGGAPSPAGDSAACRKNPQSYTCLFGHRDVLAGNPPAPGPAKTDCYDRDKLNLKWKKDWYPGYKAAVRTVFDRRLPLLRHLTAKGVAVDWWFSVEINPDGTVRAVVDQQSTYQPRGGAAYKDPMFRDDTEVWRRLLENLHVPAFPAGSVVDHVTMPVNFNNRDIGVRDPPALPQEPPLEEQKDVSAERKC